MSNRLFKWSVEADSPSNYFNLAVQGITTVSTDFAVSGTKSLKYAPTTTGSTNGDTVIRQPHSFTGTTSGDDVAWSGNKTELYFKWRQRVPSTQDGGGAGGHGWRLHPAGDNTKGLDSQTFSSVSGGQWGWQVAVADTGVDYVLNDFSDVYHWNVDAFTLFEMYIKLGTAGAGNDEIQFWINGVTTFHSTTETLRGGSTGLPTGYGEFAIFTNFDSGAPHTGGTSTWYVDDIEIWDGIPNTRTLTFGVTETRDLITSGATGFGGTSFQSSWARNNNQ